MSNVWGRNRYPHRFTVLNLCLDVYKHTGIVIANPMFDKCRSLTDRIDNEAALIYHCCRCANEDYDNRTEEGAKIRLSLQKEAIDHCLWLKTDIRLVQNRLHLRASKCIYWTDLVNKALDAIKTWHVSEKQKYKENFGL